MKLICLNKAQTSIIHYESKSSTVGYFVRVTGLSGGYIALVLPQFMPWTRPTIEGGGFGHFVGRGRVGGGLLFAKH